jgi:hypothetical protein
MQLLVIVAVIPWLIVLSRTSFYTVFRLAGAFCAGIAAIGWIIERLFEKQNIITKLIEKTASYAIWLLFVLILGSLIGYFLEKKETSF